MRLGLSSYTYTWAVGVPGAEPAHPLGADRLIERAAELGATVVQLADNLPLHERSAAEVARVASAAHAAGMRLELGTRGTHPDHLRRYLALATAVDAKLLRVVVDRDDDHPSPQQVMQRFAPLAEEFRQAGVVLAIENHDRFRCAEMRWLIEALGREWCGVCLDTINSFGALEGPEVVIGTLAPVAVNLHVKDFAVMRAWHAMGFTIEGRPAGQGRLDIPSLLSAVAQHNDDLTAVLELWTPPESALEDTIVKEQEWARSSVEFLRDALEAASG